MKYKRKWLLCITIGFLCGAFETFGMVPENSKMVAIIAMIGLENIQPSLQYIPQILFRYIPLLFFQIFYGKEIYEKFCTVGIYYFSRTEHILGWVMKSQAILFCLSFVYILMRVVGAVFVAGMVNRLTFSGGENWKFATYILIHTLYLFSSSSCINAISILKNSSTGFIITEGFSLTAIAAFAFYEPLTGDTSLTGTFSWILRINPIFFLVESMKQSFSDYWHAIMFFMATSCVVLVLICLAACKHEFICSNSEIEGL